MGISNQTYQEFFSKVQSSSRTPLEATIELTRLCNLRCAHCYIGDARWVPNSKELNFQQVAELLKVLRENGTLWLTFTGGEPTLHKDFSKIWQTAYEQGFLLTLFTNATRISPTTLNLLRSYQPRMIEVSVYGADEESYTRVTGKSGVFDVFQENVKNLIALGVRLKFKAPLLNSNLSSIEQIQKMVEMWGYPLFLEGNINASIGEGKSGGAAPCATRVSELEYIDFIKNQKSFVEEHQGIEGECSSRSDSKSNLYDCGAGEKSVYFKSDGTMQMCILTEHRGVKIFSEPDLSKQFKAAWNGFEGVRAIQRSEQSPCKTCDLWELCEVCPGFSYLETKDENAAVEWLCRSTHLKAMHLKVPHKCDIKHFVYSPKNDREVPGKTETLDKRGGLDLAQI